MTSRTSRLTAFGAFSEASNFYGFVIGVSAHVPYLRRISALWKASGQSLILLDFLMVTTAVR